MTLINFGLMPASMSCVESPQAEDKHFPMVWGVNADGLLAVSDPPPLEVVYQNQHTDPAVSGIWIEHHQRFAQFLLGSFKGGSVLEIGGGTGLLAEIVQNSIDRPLDWLILEPFAPDPLPLINRVVWKKGWFPQGSPTGKSDCIVATHVLEHTTSPQKFIQDCAQELAVGGQLFLSWPDMEGMAERGDLNMLNFEHLHFLPLKVVENLLSEAGLHVRKVSNFLGHSIFIEAEKTAQPFRLSTTSPADADSLTNLAISYRERLDDLVSRMNLEVSRWTGEVNLFGAHIFSQYLIARGLETSRVSRILDNSRAKTGKRLYGTDLFVARPEILSSNSNQLILVAAALYEEEIVNQLKELELTASRIITSRSGDVDFL